MEQNQTVSDVDEASRPAGASPLVKFIIAGVALALVIGVECAMAFMVFPSAEDVAMLAQAQQAVRGTTPAPESIEPDEMEILDTQERQEISLGEFAVTAYQPLSNTTLRIDFQLYGVVLEKDANDLMLLLDENKHRFREQVIVILRSAEMTDLTDAGLGLIKRKILEKTNRVLGRSLLQEVIFSDFSFVEQ